MISDAWNAQGSAHGIYSRYVKNLVMEENVFDHNGWMGSNREAPRSQGGAYGFSHNIYLYQKGHPATVRNNLIFRGSFHGAKFRSGGTIEDNLFVGNSAGMIIMGKAVVRKNIVMEGTEMRKDEPYQAARGFQLMNPDGMVIENNILAKVATDGWSFPYEIRATDDSGTKRSDNRYRFTFRDNIAFNWGGGMYLVQTSNYDNAEISGDVERNLFHNDDHCHIYRNEGKFSPWYMKGKINNRANTYWVGDGRDRMYNGMGRGRLDRRHGRPILRGGARVQGPVPRRRGVPPQPRPQRLDRRVHAGSQAAEQAELARALHRRGGQRLAPRRLRADQQRQLEGLTPHSYSPGLARGPGPSPRPVGPPVNRRLYGSGVVAATQTAGKPAAIWAVAANIGPPVTGGYMRSYWRMVKAWAWRSSGS